MWSTVKYELIIVRYGEIALKGAIIRKQFTNILVNNIQNALNKKQIPNKIHKTWGRIYIYTYQIKESIIILQHIFGITSISPAVRTSSDIPSISRLVVNIAKQLFDKENSFAIRPTRTGVHTFTSQDVAMKIGHDVIQATGATVNLTAPDFTIGIEIRNENAYAFSKKYQGVGGLPLGTQGTVAALISDSVSLLAAWYLMKRGCSIVFLTPQEANNFYLNKFITTWHTPRKIISEITETTKLYKIVNKLVAEKKCDGLITSQTLYANSQDTMSVIQDLKKNITCPIFHPLIAHDKQAIDSKCKEMNIPL